jgi:hypothetical protein
MKSGGKIVETLLDRSQTQADQRSDLNLISSRLARSLGLELHSLTKARYQGLAMRTADQNDTPLTHFVSLNIGVTNVWRITCCFVNTKENTPSGPGNLDLLLGIPWLYDINTIISLRTSTIELGDPEIGEEV